MLQFLITLGGISLAMSMVIILMLILQKPIKKRFAAISRYIIWTVIILRLCIPVSLNIMPKLITLPSAIPEAETVIYEPVTPEVNYTPEELIPSEPVPDVIDEPVYDYKTEPTPTTPTQTATVEKTAFKLTAQHITTALFSVWALGAVGFIIFNLVRYRINSKRLDAALSIPAPEMYSIYDTVCRELNIKKAPALYMNRADVSPMVYGFLSPKVILPSVEMSAESITCILRHELTHYKRGDLWFKLFSMLANALHWFNPLAYAACGMMANEAELSCDESALRKTDLIGRLGYGNSMLEIVKLCKHSPKLTTGFSPKKGAVKERFENMINTTKKKKGYWIVAITLIAALLCTSIIGCATEHKSGVVQGLDDITVEQQDEPVTEEYVDMNEVEKQRVEQGLFHVRIDSWRGESEEWTLHYDFDRQTLVFENIDGRHFEYGDRSEGVFSIEPLYRHDKDMGAMAYVTGEEYGMIYYTTVYEGIGRYAWNVIILDISTGEVLANDTFTCEDVLRAHGLTEDAVNSVYCGETPEGELLPPSIGGYMWDNIEDPYISINLSMDSNFGELLCVAYYDKETQKIGMLTGHEKFVEYVDGYVEEEISE
ncbi:MAG: M56 family metallopeptidase [Clostridia bacterium]|nr:M56 family metallopeptidase [Clostridia bacterium]